MAKKPKPEGDKPTRRGRARPAVPQPELPDRRAVEGEMWHQVRALLGTAPAGDSPQDQAQALLAHEDLRKAYLGR